MSRIYIPSVMFLLLVFEGTIFQMFVPPTLDYVFVSRFLIVMLVLIGIHFGRYQGITYGIIFGCIYDIFYTQLLGVYMFGFGFIGYMFAWSLKRIRDSLLFQLLLINIAIALFDSFQFSINRFIHLTDMSFEAFIYERLIPTLVLNSAFAILIYYPVKRLFQYVEKQRSLRER